MVDWEAVERLRSKGWDWDRIADDSRVDFHADAGTGAPGRALKALYYQRRSKKSRRPSAAGRDGNERAADRAPWSIVRVGMFLTPLAAVWFLLALVYPSPIGVYLSAIPYIAILLIVAIALLAYGLLRASERWNSTYRNSVVVGAVLGLVVAGVFGLAAVAGGCPTLSFSTQSEPLNWEKAADATWTSNGVPVFYFYGAAWCPYCSAGSWAVKYALEKVGSLSGYVYDHSSLTDTYPNTPSVVFTSASLRSPYASFVVDEIPTDSGHTFPTPTGCVARAYVSAYSTGIPFVVVNGQYFHTTQLVDPGQLAGMTAPQVENQIANQSGPAWNAVSPSAYMMLALIVKVNGGQPTSAASIPGVAAYLSQIS
ncbi:MAG: DUF929 family protein [Thermoplasmata archaeon]